ncbi:MAG: HAMP domain-containing histidine kinase [Rhodothermales bacterium]|nr:HAMP domain-containing histidine kinase [Rhodothermales bacterium]
MSDVTKSLPRSDLKNSVFWRLAGILIGAQVAIGVFALLFSALFAYNESLGLIESSVRLQLDRLAEEVEFRSNLDFGIDQLPPDLIVDMSTRFPDPIKIVDRDGNLVNIVMPDPVVFSLPPSNPERFRLPDDIDDLIYNDDITVVLSAESGDSWGVAPVYDRSGLVAGAIVVQPLDQTKRFELAGARRAYIRALIIVTLVAGVLALIIGALFTWRLIKPLRRFADRVERIRDGDFKARVEEYSTDEFGRLAESINEMAGHVDKSFEALKSADALRRELVANVGHDLRTPLTAIRGYVDEARRALDEGDLERSVEALNIASDQGKYITQLVEDLFELSVLDNASSSLRIEPVPITELLNESARSHRGLFEEAGVDFRIDTDVELPIIEADGVRLLRLLDNLLSNARNHVQRGGTVWLTGKLDKDFVVISVKDDGAGMTAEDSASIFDRYYRGEGPRTRGSRGTGLGLPISRAIADAHNGTLEVETEEGVGSTFTVRLPVVLWHPE